MNMTPELRQAVRDAATRDRAAAEQTTIRVTAKDISRATGRGCDDCIMATVLRRLGYEGATAGFASVQVWGQFYSLPPKATAFIRRYCDGLPVRPTSFRLPIPPPPARKGKSR